MLRIDSIAFVCPLLGGNAVFQARSLQATYNDTLDYDDKLICNQQGVFYKLAQKDSSFRNEEVLNLFPNPTNNTLNVYLDSDIKVNYNIEIYSLLGQQLLEIKNCSNEIKFQLASSELANGNYFLLMTQNDTGKTFRKRFVYNTK